MKPFNNLILDDGYRFGLGAFETISVKNGRGILLPYHLERLKNALETLEIPVPISLEAKAADHICRMQIAEDVLRVTVSLDNTVWETRQSAYAKEQYVQGFHLMLSAVRRNETSPLTRIKSLNQGDNILQRRLAAQRGFDEAIFLNSRGELTEGTATNLFFVLDRRLYTPATDCGLLAGTVRRWLIEKHGAQEIRLLPRDLPSFQEMFITNAVLGIMPVRRFGADVFSGRLITNELLDQYRKMAREQP